MSSNAESQRVQSSPLQGDSSVGMNAEKLKARLYATSELMTNARPQLKMIRSSRSPNTAQVSFSLDTSFGM